MRVITVMVGVLIVVVGTAGFELLHANTSDCQPFISELQAFLHFNSFQCELTFVMEFSFLILFILGFAALGYGTLEKNTSKVFKLTQTEINNYLKKDEI